MPHDLTNHCLDCGKAVGSTAQRCRDCNAVYVARLGGRLCEHTDPTEEEMAEIESRRKAVLAEKLEKELAGLRTDGREWWE